MSYQGYLRYPTLSSDVIILTAEDDLWRVQRMGGRAERLTAGVNEVSQPRLSPDGSQVAFVSREEGPREIYVMPAVGGPTRRLTYQSAARVTLAGWSRDGQRIIYSSSAQQAFDTKPILFAIDPTAQPAQPTPLAFGPAVTIGFGPGGGVVLGRNTADLARWKRYRGGTAGALWIDVAGDGEFERLLPTLRGNIASPCWVADRIFFIADHEGIGNVYSCTPTGRDLRRHSDHGDYYARFLTTDGQSLIYTAGGDVFVLDPRIGDTSQRVDISLPSPRTQRNRRFVSATDSLHDYSLHPKGTGLALVARGKPYTCDLWEGAVLQHGESDGVRYRQATWLNDGKRLVMVSDQSGEERLEVHVADGSAAPRTFLDLDCGLVLDLAIAPTGAGDRLALTNHRQEVLLVDLDAGTMHLVDHSQHNRIAGLAWSPDGRWLAYGLPTSPQKTAIMLCDTENGSTYPATMPVLQDVQPAFDPTGRYLCFIGTRIFDPVYDNVQFDLGFPQGMRPYIVLLQADLPSPLVPRPRAPGATLKDAEKKTNDDTKKVDDAESGAVVAPVRIDLDGIADRVVGLPVPEGLYGDVLAIEHKLLFMVYPVQGSLSAHDDDEDERVGSLWVYDFDTQKADVLTTGVSAIALSRDHKTLVCRAGDRLRVVAAGEQIKDGDDVGRATGWVDLERVRVSVLPPAEWRQMYDEAWRLQREFFWTANLSDVDWTAVYQRYLPLIDRVTTRSEMSDLLWEMQGELGTSHAYEMGGDYRKGPTYAQGFLGATFTYDATHAAYRIGAIVRGDAWDALATSPLAAPGLRVAEGALLLAINGQRLSPAYTPEQALVHQAGQDVLLTLRDSPADEPRAVLARALASEGQARYRAWVEANRVHVHDVSAGRVGYVHIPDMGAHGYAEFHRGYLAEYDYPSLLVDVRNNRGGHVSGLLLEKLARRRQGYDYTRWAVSPQPYPAESPRGPLVALTDEHAGSDGDIFSHTFKLMKLGLLVGTRTWGGVIGIWPRRPLVDGTITTQPELSFWFADVGWRVENYGTDPDIEVQIAPQDYARGEDPQLTRAIAEALRALEAHPSQPLPEPRPSLALPRLPPRR